MSRSVPARNCLAPPAPCRGSGIVANLASLRGSERRSNLDEITFLRRSDRAISRRIGSQDLRKAWLMATAGARAPGISAGFPRPATSAAPFDYTASGLGGGEWRVRAIAPASSVATRRPQRRRFALAQAMHRRDPGREIAECLANVGPKGVRRSMKERASGRT